MKKLIVMLFIAIPLLLTSCSDEPVSFLSDIKESDHILSGYFVTSIAFDSKGTAWIGTFGQGLIKYDGSVTKYDSGNSSLPDSLNCNSIAVDKNDNVWIGSGKGLIKYDNKNFVIYNKSNAPLVTDNVFALTVDKDNSIWFTSCVFRTGGLMKFDGTNFQLFTPMNSEMPGNLINDVVTDNQNNVWAAVSGEDGNCIVKITGSKFTVYGKKDFGFSAYNFSSLAVGKNDKIYAYIDYSYSSSIVTDEPQIISYDGRSWQIINRVDEFAGYFGKISADLKGNLWTATMHGMAAYNGQRWINNKSQSADRWVSDISVDRQNRVWAACSDGIYIYN